MLTNEAAVLTKVVVSRPVKAFYEVANTQHHNISQLADRERALKQHDLLTETMRDFGAEVIFVDELEGHPNSVFTKDCITVVPGGYVQLRMGLPTRAGEPAWMAAFLDQLGEPLVGRIEAPGTVEGGDVILAGKTAFVGLSSRTNIQGAVQLEKLLAQYGIETRMAHIPPLYLHIGGAMTLVSPHEVLYCQGVFPEGYFDGFQQIEVVGGDLISGNVIALGNKEIISDARNVVTNEALRLAGYKVHALDLSEFVKGNGGPSCLMLSLERK